MLRAPQQRQASSNRDSECGIASGRCRASQTATPRRRGRTDPGEPESAVCTHLSGAGQHRPAGLVQASRDCTLPVGPDRFRGSWPFVVHPMTADTENHSTNNLPSIPVPAAMTPHRLLAHAVLVGPVVPRGVLVKRCLARPKAWCRRVVCPTNSPVASQHTGRDPEKSFQAAHSRRGSLAPTRPTTEAGGVARVRVVTGA